MSDFLKENKKTILGIVIALIVIIAIVLVIIGTNKEENNGTEIPGTENLGNISTEIGDSTEAVSNKEDNEEDILASREDKTTENQTPGTETENTPDTPPASETPQETPTPPAEEKPQYTYTDLNKTMYATSAVNVRDLPSTDGSKVGGLSKGQAVTVTGQCNETKWYRITLNGSVAYVSNNYLTDTKPQEETPAPPSSENTTPSNPAPSEPSTPSQPSQPSQPSNSNKDDLGNTIDRNKVDMVYTNASIGDGLDEYRNGLHMWTADGKYPLYVHMEWNGKIGYFQLAEDGYEKMIPFKVAYKELPYMNGFSAMSSTDYDPYVFVINGKYYQYQFMYMY